MKTSFGAVIVFIISFIFLSFFSSTLYYLYFNANQIVAGASASLQPLSLFMQGFLFVWDSSCVISLGMVLFYFIRHTERSVSAFIVWLILCFFVFIIVQPLSFLLLKNFSISLYNRDSSTLLEKNILTPNVFREKILFDEVDKSSKETVLFLTDVDENTETASGILFSAPLGYVLMMQKETFVNDEDLFVTISGVRDPLIINSISQPIALMFFLDELTALKSKFLEKFFETNTFFSVDFITHYAGYASIGLAFCGIFVFVTASSWKLFNMLYIILASFSLLHINFLFQCKFDMNILSQAFSGLSFTLPLWIYPILLNVLIALFFLTLSFFTGQHKEKSPAEELDL